MILLNPLEQKQFALTGCFVKQSVDLFKLFATTVGISDSAIIRNCQNLLCVRKV